MHVVPVGQMEPAVLSWAWGEQGKVQMPLPGSVWVGMIAQESPSAVQWAWSVKEHGVQNESGTVRLSPPSGPVSLSAAASGLWVLSPASSAKSASSSRSES